MKIFTALAMFLPAIAVAGHMDIIDHPQFPNGGNYADVPKVFVAAQGHWTHPHPTLGDFPMHLHIEVLDAPIYAEVSEPFDITVRIVMFRWPAEARGHQFTASWNSGGGSIGTALLGQRDAKDLSNAHGDPNGVVSETRTLTITPEVARYSGKVELTIKAHAEYNTEPFLRTVATVKLPIYLNNGAPPLPEHLKGLWHPSFNTVTNALDPNGDLPPKRVPISYGKIWNYEFVPILPISEPWPYDVQMFRADGALNKCGSDYLRAWLRMDPALHADNYGQEVYSFEANQGSGFHRVSGFIDPADYSAGEHTFMMRTLSSVGNPNTCIPLGAPYQAEPNLTQEAFGVYKFTIGNVPPPPPKQCNDGIDNDGDGWIDLMDMGCVDANDDDETDPPPITYHDSICVAEIEARDTNPQGSWTTGACSEIEYQRVP